MTSKGSSPDKKVKNFEDPTLIHLNITSWDEIIQKICNSYEELSSKRSVVSSIRVLFSPNLFTIASFSTLSRTIKVFLFNEFRARPKYKFQSLSLVDKSSPQNRYCELMEFSDHSFPITCMDFSPDGEYLSCGQGPMVNIWNYKKNVETQFLRLNSISSGISGNSSLSSQNLLYTDFPILEGHNGTITCLKFSPNNKFLASTASDKTIRVWKINTFYAHRKGNRSRIVSVLRGHSDLIEGVCFSSSNRYVISVSNDKSMRIWDFAGEKCIKIIYSTLHPFSSVDISPQDEFIVVGGKDGSVFLYDFFFPPKSNHFLFWEICTGKLKNVFRVHAKKVNQVSFSPCGRYFATSGLDYQFCIFHISTNKCLSVASTCNNSYDPTNHLKLQQNLLYHDLWLSIPSSQLQQKIIDPQFIWWK